MFASIAGSQLLHARITIPQFGIWHGDAILDGDTSVTGDQSVILGDLTLSGHAFRSAAFVGRRKVRLVGGHGGWSSIVPSQAYYDPSGVLVSHVLGDVASACGETLTLAADSRPWIRYVRETMPGARALNQILGLSWWVDTDGSTKNAARSTKQISSSFQVEKFDGAKGLFTVSVDVISDWMPGNTFIAPTISDVQTISSATLILNGPKSRFEIETNTAALDSGDRLSADMLSLVRETFPSLTFLGTYEYVVRSSGGFDPVDVSLGLPSISNADMRIPLATVTLKSGDSIRVRFADGRPWRPEICDAPASSTAITIGNASPAAIGRVGDSIRLSDSDIANIIAPSGGSGGPCSVSPGTHVNGTITGGSGQVQSG